MGLRLLAGVFHLPTAVLYGSLSFFLSVLHNVFLLYYVDTFVSVYKIDKLSFWIGETVFLIWNSLNDPLFGWLSDRIFLSTKQSNVDISTPEVVLKRLNALGRNGPLFALSFLAFWVSWAHPGLQFLICLCLYDSFLTMVDLNHNALLADLAVSAVERTRLNFHCSLFSAIGSLSVFASYTVWNKEDFFSFRIFCVILAAVSALGFTVSTWLLKQRFQTGGSTVSDQDLLKELYVEESSVSPEKNITLLEYLRQLSRQRNFLWFVCMNLVQVFHCHFNSNFFPLFLEHLLADKISVSTGSFLLGISYIAPHLNNMYFLSLCQKYGVYSVVRWLFIIKLVLSILMLLAGPDQISLLCIFIASNRVFTEGTCKLLNLVISDLVDEDFVLNRRKQAASALMFGMVALVTKPGQTIAPLAGTWLLCVYTGYDIFQRDALNNISTEPQMDSSRVLTTTLRQGCFYLLVFIPITCALLQLFTWSHFTLHGKRLITVKTYRQAQNGVPPDVKTI
ncbi:transmembrane protein 180 [Rana temporaria]|uniref:transmembrane protein 180 n=1 Tax=Rana temporaria TaxID=8407 RepID=UPI001AAD29FB|nr:transmembrane protein 180 [Rana temporaria]XP_040217825.1 transmembrane protein 180 [Rana temporaria]XP_040217826.1 transmembrane protein 180 [Rana temporaria]XP_040217827.1 transmembrane protein 180 [Rana temporaria]